MIIKLFVIFLDDVTVLLNEILQGARNLTQAELYVKPIVLLFH